LVCALGRDAAREFLARSNVIATSEPSDSGDDAEPRRDDD
jgi:hypothetical protein